MKKKPKVKNNCHFACYECWPTWSCQPWRALLDERVAGVHEMNPWLLACLHFFNFCSWMHWYRGLRSFCWLQNWYRKGIQSYLLGKPYSGFSDHGGDAESNLTTSVKMSFYIIYWYFIYENNVIIICWGLEVITGVD